MKLVVAACCLLQGVDFGGNLLLAWRSPSLPVLFVEERNVSFLLERGCCLVSRRHCCIMVVTQRSKGFKSRRGVFVGSVDPCWLSNTVSLHRASEARVTTNSSRDGSNSSSSSTSLRVL